MDGASLNPKKLRFEDQIEAFPFYFQGVGSGKIFTVLGEFSYCDGLDLASQAWRRSDAQSDEEDIPISYGRFSLTGYPLFRIFNPS